MLFLPLPELRVEMRGAALCLVRVEKNRAHSLAPTLAADGSGVRGADFSTFRACRKSHHQPCRASPLSRMLTFGAGESGVGWFGEDAGYV